MWKAAGRLRAAEKQRLKAIERRRAAGLADTREQHAIRVAQQYIARGATRPDDRLLDYERYGKLKYASPMTKHRHGVSQALYVQAFLECMRARAEGCEPIWHNLDLVDDPMVTFASTKARKRCKPNRTSDGPEYDDGAPGPANDDWEPSPGARTQAPLTPEQRKAKAAARKAYLDTPDEELSKLLRAIDRPKSLI